MCAINLEARASDVNAQVSASMTSARGFILKRTSWPYNFTFIAVCTNVFPTHELERQLERLLSRKRNHVWREKNKLKQTYKWLSSKKSLHQEFRTENFEVLFLSSLLFWKIIWFGTDHIPRKKHRMSAWISVGRKRFVSLRIWSELWN